MGFPAVHRTDPAPQRVPNRPNGISNQSWEQLDSVDSREVFLQRVPMLKSCPRFLRGRLRFCFGVALRERNRAKLEGDQIAESRAWKLFGLVPTMLLHRPKHSRDELAKRADDFAQGRWLSLLTTAQQQNTVRITRTEQVDDHVRRGMAAQSRVERGHVSRARHELTGAPLAPKNQDTQNELQGRRPQERVCAIPQEVLDFRPEAELQSDANFLRSASKVLLPVLLLGLGDAPAR